MRVLVTGSSSGIGKASANKFLQLGHEVFGIDVKESSIDDENYHHFQVDVQSNCLPDIDGVEILFNNAGLQNCVDDIDNNLKGTINVTEKYLKDNKKIRAILFNVSASATSGQEFPEYVASKAGLLGYMRNVAIRVSSLGAVCNAISLGGVLTDSNKAVISDKKCWEQIMNTTPLKKWANLDEVADWVAFLTLTNKSMSGQNLLVDNGEKDLNPTFVWPNFKF